MKNHEIVTVLDHEVVCAVINEQPYISIVHVGRAIGLDVENARINVKNHPIFGSEVCVHTVRGSENWGGTVSMLPLDMLPGWLFSINPNKVSEEASEKLIAFQKHCYRVLSDYFFGPRKAQLEAKQREHVLREERRNLSMQRSEINNRVKVIDRELEDLHNESWRQMNLFKLRGQVES